MALILVTDDAAFTRRMIRKALVENDEHVVIEASNGVECLEMLDSHSPDCILLDLLMPELDGYGVLEAVRDRGLKTPVIVLSADIQDSARKQCMELGAYAMLKKPPKPPEVRSMINQAIEAS
ncbi:MAG: response regulator [Cyanobacteria bacterium J06648_11]